MISDYIAGNATLVEVLLCIPIVLIALSVHECAHGYAAYKMGDPTARNFGRLTLNPIKHLDPIGTICMLFLGFGWAKPVPVNVRNFNKPKKGMALTALAGPLSNLLLALLGVLFLSVLDIIYLTVPSLNESLPFGAIGVWQLSLLDGATMAYKLYWVLGNFFYLFHILNISLAIFNLLPIPPLDGSRLAMLYLPDKLYFKLMQYEQIIQIVLLVGLFTGVLSKPLGYLAVGLSDLMSYIHEFLVGLAL
ncbi:MAG: site-2 protease family protein [Clostridia bacterium]|nr:site-2 protease family protein [Clostridia bacterium]